MESEIMRSDKAKKKSKKCYVDILTCQSRKIMLLLFMNVDESVLGLCLCRLGLMY